MVDVAQSVNGVPIRLTSERWLHVVENHDDLAGHYDDCLATVEEPDFVLRGYGGTLIAIRGAGRGRYLAVVYKEVSPDDGFAWLHANRRLLVRYDRYPELHDAFLHLGCALICWHLLHPTA